MIDLLTSSYNSIAFPYVFSAFTRSVSVTQVRRIYENYDVKSISRILVLINPIASNINLVQRWRELGPGKLIIFGKLSAEFVNLLNLQITMWPVEDQSWYKSPSAPVHGYSESPAQVVYNDNAIPLVGYRWRRPLERFDFSNEWNNLGYGAIRRDNSIWALSLPAIAAANQSLADINMQGLPVATYCSLHNDNNHSMLWFNREVGPIDSFEWRLVENYISSWRFEELPCQPVLSEIPWGFTAAVTMRLDCDEDIESSRPLRALYQDLNVPFSLAVHTGILDNKNQHSLIKEMAAAGDSILSHTATHAPNWGGSYENALREAYQSKDLLEKISGKSIKYAVSPFHHTPHYALEALVAAGFSGCIGGIICNDPEFLFSRGGQIAGISDGFVGHSQQCMFHGDCLLKSSDPIVVYKNSFQIAQQTRTLFGYLDHPFSDRYQYGWNNEKYRLSVHETFIAYVRSVDEKTVFMSEDDAMDFLLRKSLIKIIQFDGLYGFDSLEIDASPCCHDFAVEYCEKVYPVKIGLIA